MAIGSEKSDSGTPGPGRGWGGRWRGARGEGRYEEGVATWRSYPGAEPGRGTIFLGKRGGEGCEGVMAEP